MAEAITISNDAARILSTNFWQTAHARQGYFYCSINAGVFRLLIPQSQQRVVREMRTAPHVVVSRGPLTQDGRTVPEALGFLFDDSTDTPLSLHIGHGQFDRVPSREDEGGTFRCTVWTHRVGETGQQVLDLPAYYRRSRRLPDLRPWQGLPLSPAQSLPWA